MISDPLVPADSAFVWIWLPGQTDPVVCGRIFRQDGQLVFNYGQSYLERPDSVPIFEEELPLKSGAHLPAIGTEMAGCLRDAAPDAWGRRVIQNRLLVGSGSHETNQELDELVYLLQSGSDRFGAIDFQTSSQMYVARDAGQASIDDLLQAAEHVEKGVPLSPALEQALLHGTSLGGARPKALVSQQENRYIAKFSSTTDTHNVVKAEYVAMRLAASCGLDVASVRLEHVMAKDVLLVRRFDREMVAPDGLDREKVDGVPWSRRMVVSALTLLGLTEMQARYASYQDLAERIRHIFEHPRRQLHELHDRLMVNVLLGNSDDHARNHALFCEPGKRTLTPAYDICPQRRGGAAANQAMFIQDERRDSRLETVFSAAPLFFRSREEAIARATSMMEIIQAEWPRVAREACLEPVDRAWLWKGPFLHPFAFEHLGPDAEHLVERAQAVRESIN